MSISYSTWYGLQGQARPLVHRKGLAMQDDTSLVILTVVAVLLSRLLCLFSPTSCFTLLKDHVIY